ncbi:MAG: DUF2490 domain-containing protein [Draconibacterium sp.]|nr:DUF2490 domain-containing protein [Draconibacterium sp.]
MTTIKPNNKPYLNIRFTLKIKQDSKRLLQLALLFVALFCSTVSARASEFENWTFIGVNTEWKKMEFSVSSANFFIQGGGYFLNHTQLSLDFPSKNSFSLGVGYKQEYVKFPLKWRTEYRPMLHLYYTKIWGHFEFRDRSRWEFRFMDGELIHRYRNQIQLSFNKFNVITPYLSTEFSFYLKEPGYSRQRTVLGAGIPIKNLYLNLFLGHQVDKIIPGEWYNKFMMGTGLSFSF